MNKFDLNKNNSPHKPLSNNNMDVIDITNSESDIMSMLNNSQCNNIDKMYCDSNTKKCMINIENKQTYDGSICNGGCNNLNSYEIIFLLACKYDYTIIIDYILSNNIIDRFNISLANDKHTPIHYIIENWKDDEAHKKIFNTLLNKKNIKSFIDSVGIGGDTPIILATKKGIVYICELLDKYGANKSIENNEGLCVITDESEFSDMSFSKKINGNITHVNIMNPLNIIEDSHPSKNKNILDKNAEIFLSGLIKNHINENNNSDTSIYSLLSNNIQKNNKGIYSYPTYSQKSHDSTHIKSDTQKYDNSMDIRESNDSTYVNKLDEFVKKLNDDQTSSTKYPNNILDNSPLQKGGKKQNNDIISGTRQMLCFNTNRNSVKNNETQYMSELDKLINEQVAVIDKRATNNIQSLMNIDKHNAKKLINKIYNNINEQNPSLKHLDRAMAMEQYINLDDLNNLINDNHNNSTLRNSNLNIHSSKKSCKKTSKKSSKKTSKKS